MLAEMLLRKRATWLRPPRRGRYPHCWVRKGFSKKVITRCDRWAEAGVVFTRLAALVAFAHGGGITSRGLGLADSRHARRPSLMRPRGGLLRTRWLPARSFLDQLLDVGHQAGIAARHQRDGQADAPARCAADAVHIVFGVERRQS